MLYQQPKSAIIAHYLSDERLCVLSAIEENSCLDKYFDVLHSSNLIDVFHDGCITDDNVIPLFSINSAQCYAKKDSVCWIYIWVLFNLSSDKWYKKKHIFIGSFIFGPNNPKSLDSFYFYFLDSRISLPFKRKVFIFITANFSRKYSLESFSHCSLPTGLAWCI